ncbi:MAG: hypothetical protein WCB68_15485 [Pyrinomonadaceae bacterium]
MPLKVTRRLQAREIAKRMIDGVRAANMETAQEIAEEARRGCPVSGNNEPGHVHTRDTITAKANEDGSAIVEAGGAAIFIELGTRFTSPHPFFIPAIEAAQRRHWKRVKEAARLK